MTRLLTTCAAVVSLSACGLIGGTSGDGGTSGTGGGSGSPTGAAVKSALSAPATGVSLEQVTATQGVNGIWLASQASGGAITTTGVLTQSAAGWTYAAGGGVLELRFSNGVVNQYTFTTFNGDVSGDYNRFLSSPHQLAWHFVNPGKATLDFAENVTSTGGSGTVAGTWTDDANVSWQANLSFSGTNKSTVDSNWAEYERQYALSGTVSGGGAAVTANESLYSHMIYSNSTLSQNVIRTVNDSWTDGAGTWTVADFETRKAFVNSAPGDHSYWLAKGSVLLNGATVGTVSLKDNGATIDAVLTMNGQDTVLESTVNR